MKRKKQILSLFAAAALLPVMGYLVGFTKVQDETAQMTAEEITYDFSKLPPDAAGTIVIKNAAAWKVPDATLSKVALLTREFAAKYEPLQKAEWEKDQKLAQLMYEGKALKPRTGSVDELTNPKKSPAETALQNHNAAVGKLLTPALRNKVNNATNTILNEKWGSPTHFKLLFNPETAETLHLSERQRNQMQLLEKMYATIVKENLSMSSADDIKRKLNGTNIEFARTQPGTKAHKISVQRSVFKDKSKPGVYVVFISTVANASSMGEFYRDAKDYLDPLQALKLEAMYRDQTYVAAP